METDLHLINKVKEEGDSFSVKELIDRHSGIYVEMVNKYLPDDMDGIMKNDVLEDKNFVFMMRQLSLMKAKTLNLAHILVI